jgi:hypothetical protein
LKRFIIMTIAARCLSILLLLWVWTSRPVGSSSLRQRKVAQRKPPYAGGTVTKLVLINAKTDRKVADLFYGQYTNVSQVAPEFLSSGVLEFNVEAVVAGAVDFVRFGYGDNTRFHSEGAAPYALCGNQGPTNFRSCPVLGYATHYVTATPITNRTPGPVLTVTFTIARN